MKELVNWPETGHRYRDSGEGGLFAWMMVPEAISSGEAHGPEAAGFNNCYVDVSAYLSRPRIMLNRPDVCVSAQGRNVYTHWDFKNSWFQRSKEIGQRLDPDKDYRLKQALHQAMGSDDISVPMLASIFLGSTCHSLWDETLGCYFEVSHPYLTQDGKLQYELWQRVYGVDPIILTFLDT